MKEKLTLRNIYRAGDDVASAWLTAARWGNDVLCPKCETPNPYRITTRKTFKCRNKHCHKQFSVYSQTKINSTKLKSTDVLGALFIFAASAKGVSSLHMQRLLGVSQNAAWVLCHKFREAIYEEMQQIQLDGTVEIDGATFGGHRRYYKHGPYPQTGERRKKFSYVPKTKNKRVVVVAHQRMGRTVVFSGAKESDAVDDIKSVISDSTVIQADGAHAWDGLERLYEMLRIEHKYSFSANGACTNNAENYFSQLRRMHFGTHHQISGELLIYYAAEMAWRLDMCEMTATDKTLQLAKTVLNAEKSEKWNGYFQRKTCPVVVAEAA